MSTPQDFMNRLFSQAATPVANPEIAAAGRLAGLAPVTGYGTESIASPLELDARTMTAAQLSQKYGTDAALQLLGNAGSAQNRYNELANDNTRTGFDAINDTTQDIADGFVNSILGIAGGATGLVSSAGGTAIAEASEDYNEWSSGKRSQQTQSRRMAQSIRDELRQRDNAAAYEADKKVNGDGISTDLRRIGREALSGGAALFDDGTTFGGDVSQALGSLASAGPVGKGFNAGAKALAAGVSKAAPRATGALSEVVAASRAAGASGSRADAVFTGALDKLQKNAGVMAAITAMEAGGSYVDTAQEVLGMDYGTLTQHSPIYNELLAQGMTPEEARKEVANTAALKASGQTALIAAPLSALVARFEGNVFTRNPISKPATNILSEATEEGGIGLAGGLAQNAAIQQTADRTRSISEGVGEQVGVGAVLGAAAAGVAQGARVPAVGALAATEALSSVKGASTRAISAEKQAVISEQSDKVQAAVETAAPSLETLDPEGKRKWESVERAYAFDPEDFSPEAVGPVLSPVLEGSKNLPEALTRLTEILKTSKDPGVRNTSSLVVDQIVSDMESVLGDEDAYLVAGIPQVDEAMTAMASSMKTALADPVILEARETAKKFLQQALNDAESAPEEKVEAANRLMTLDPLAIEPEQGKLALKHAEEGIGNMTPASRAALEVSLEVVEADRAMRAEMESQGFPATSNDNVSSQVRSSNEWGDGTAQSLSGHIGRIMNFVTRGSESAAQDQAEHLTNFAQNMLNKVEALNTHYENGDPRGPKIGYSQYTKDGRWRDIEDGDESGALYVTPYNQKSVTNARAIEADARMAANIVNAMADAFPQLGLTKLPLPKLSNGLQGSLEEVIERHRPKKQGPAPIKRGQNAEAPAPAVVEKAQKIEPTKQEESAPVARPTAAPEQVQAKKGRYAQQKAAAKEAKKEEAPAPVVSRVTPEQAKRLSDEGLNERLQNLVGKRADGKATPEDNATFDVLDAEMIEREDASAVEVDLMALDAEVQAAPQEETSETVEEESPVAPETRKVEPKAGMKAEPAMVERFPRLHPKTWFRQIFKTNKAESVLQGRTIQEVAEILISEEVDSLAPEVGLLDADVRDVYQELISEDGQAVLEALQVRLETFLDKPVSSKSDETFAEYFAKNDVLMHAANGRVLHLLDESEAGDLFYNQELATAGVLSAFQWFLNSGSSAPKTADEWAEDLGIRVTVADADRLNSGSNYESAIDEIASRIQRYWNVTPNADAPTGMIQGIANALAQEVLEVLMSDDFGLVSVENVFIRGQATGAQQFDSNEQVIDKVNIREIRRLTVNKSKIPEAFNKDSGVIDRLVMKSPNGGQFYVGDAKPVPHTTRHNQPRVLNTPEQIDVLKRVTDEVYTLNKPFSDLVNALTKDGALTLFAEGPLENENLNIYDRESRDGRNLGVVNALDAFSRLTTHMATKVGENQTIEDVPVRYDYNFITSNRLMMLGDSNPVSNKVMRALMLPTWSTVDLTSEDGTRAWALAVGQGLGVKIHTQSLEQTKADVERLLTGPLANALDKLTQWDQARAKGKGKKISDETAKAIRNDLKAAGVSDPAWGMFVLVEQARLNNASVADRKSFKTPVYLEADGVTNGPIMGMMMLMTSGHSLNPQKLQALRKGGVAIGYDRMTLADMRAMDPVDLYGASGKNTPKYLEAALAGQSKEILESSDDLLKLMQNMLGAKQIRIVTTADGASTLVVDRGLTKNPLTITLYGSGAKGIAGNLVDEILAEYHSRISEVFQKVGKKASQAEVDAAYDEAFPDGSYDLLMKMSSYFMSFNRKTENYEIALNEDGSKLPGRNKTPAPRSMLENGNSLENATLSEVQRANLQSFLLNMFVEPLRSAINETVGNDVVNGMAQIQKVTSVQSWLALTYFENHLFDLLAQKREADPEFRNADFLSGKELDALFLDLEKKFPKIEMNGFTFDLMGKVKSFLSGVDVSDILIGNRKMSAKFYGPTSLGVGGIPAMIQGAGDASTVLTAYQTGKMGRTMPVYDGFHLALDQINSQSELLNENAYKAMLNNPIEAVTNSLKTTLKEVSITELIEPLVDSAISEQGKSKMTKLKLRSTALGRVTRSLDLDINDVVNVFNKLSKPEIKKAIDEMVTYRLGVLVEVSDIQSAMIDINHKVVAAVGGSYDQMASGFSPAVVASNQQVSMSDKSDQALSDELQGRTKTLMLESDNPIVVELAKEISVNQKATEDLPPLAPVSQGEKLPSGAIKLSMDHLLERSRGKDLSPTQRAVLREILRSRAAQDWTIVTGTPEQLAAYSSAADELISPESNTAVHGLSDFGTKTIFLPQNSNETLIHELVHAATMQIVLDVLGGKKMPAHAKSAVANLEGLLKDFVSINPAQMPAGALIAFNESRMTVETYLAENSVVSKAKAINEMMAWTLSNKSLGDALKTKSVSTQLRNLTQRLFNAVKRMFWGGATIPAPAENFIDTLRFNAEVLMNTTPAIESLDPNAGKLKHSTTRAATLSEMKDRLTTRLDAFLSQDFDPSKLSRTPATQVIRATQASKKKLDELVVSGFQLSGEQRDAAHMLMTVMGTSMEIDPSVLNTAQKVYNHAMTHLTPDSFIAAGIDRNLAVEMYDAITGKQDQGRDALDRSLLLPSFLAMALVSDTMQKVLRDIPAIKNPKVRADTFDQTLDNLGDAAMDSLDRYLSGRTGKEANVNQVIQNLAARIQASAIAGDSWYVNTSGNAQSLLDKGNDILVGLIGKADTKIAKKVAGLYADPENKWKKRAADSLTILRGGLTNEGAEKVALGATELINQEGVSQWVRDLTTDMIGRTSENADLYDRIKIVRTKVQQSRQHYREEVPSLFHKKFNKAPTAKQYASMSKTLGNTDIAVLLETMDIGEVLNILKSESKLDAALVRAEDALMRAAKSTNQKEMKFKADQLANFLVTKKPGVGLIRNAYVMALKLGNGISPASVKAIDNYVSLKALKDSNKYDLEALRDVLEEDSDAVGFMLSYNKQQRKIDHDRMESAPLARMNHFKGFLPSPMVPGQRLVVRPLSEHAALVERGYTRVGDYNGSSAERVKEPRAYYFSPVDGQAVFNQGLIQNTQQSVGGVQLSTGFSLSQNIAGRITDRKRVEKITSEIATRGDKGDETLMPLLDASGNIVGYERSVRQDMLDRIVEETHYGKSLGMWRGRQVEEQAGDVLNQELVKILKDKYEKATSVAKTQDFINLRSTEAYTDPVIRDAAQLLTKDVVAMLDREFGEDGPIWVERSMLKDVLGYRAATVGDVWTGTTRLSKDATDLIKDLLVTVLGKEAYTKAVRTERFVQGAVTDARVLIAVKSVIVPAVNMVSNILHLIGRGVPLHLISKMPEKLNELHQYVQMETQRVATETELTAAVTGSLEHRKLTNRLKSIEDSQGRLSIWPLIEAGEFSTVAEVGLTHEDLLLTRGRLSDYIETQIDKLPPGVATVGHNLLLSKHTALFRGLQKSVQYGDFLAKAVLFDHVVKGKGKPAQEALAQITEEFVNYDRLPGRARAYLESVGLLWFYNFKLRSVKVAFSTIRNNPLHTLLAMWLPVPDMFGNPGIPVEDNALTKLLGGNILNSVGPGQGFHALGLNPWLNATN